MVSLFVSKLIAILSLGIGTVVVGLLPAGFKSNRGRKRLPLSLLLCFGGGVLLATSLYHILPEAKHDLPTQLRPYAELVLIAGFFLLYIVDEFVHLCHGKNYIELIETQQPSSPPPSPPSAPPFSSVHIHSASPNYGTNLTTPLLPHHYDRRRSSAGNLSNIESHAPSQLCHVGHQEPCTSEAVNIGLLISLTLHASIEGLVVGLASDPSQVLMLFGAIASHKFVVAFCMSAELVGNSHSGNFRKTLSSVVIFTLGTIGGIVIGMVISGMPDELTLIWIPILQLVGSGTLLYVTVSEVLPRERARWHYQHNSRIAGLLQCGAVLVGFGMMVLLDYACK